MVCAIKRVGLVPAFTARPTSIEIRPIEIGAHDWTVGHTPGSMN
jgi:hypothetical protein